MPQAGLLQWSDPDGRGREELRSNGMVGAQRRVRGLSHIHLTANRRGVTPAKAGVHPEISRWIPAHGRDDSRWLMMPPKPTQRRANLSSVEVRMHEVMRATLEKLTVEDFVDHLAHSPTRQKLSKIDPTRYPALLLLPAPTNSFDWRICGRRGWKRAPNYLGRPPNRT